MTPTGWPGVGATYADGAYVTTDLIAGSDSRGRWRGVQRDGATVIIAARFMPHPGELVDRFRYQGPGIAPLLYVGPPDGYTARPEARSSILATVEREPAGVAMQNLALQISVEDVLRIGVGMAEMVAAATASKRVITGIRPEVAYAQRDEDGWVFSGLCPMAYCLLGHGYDDGGITPFTPDTYVAPEYLDDEINQRADVFSLALVLWYLATGSHAYDWKPDQDDNIYLDRRKSWTGPEELGDVLTSALWNEPERRASIEEFRAGLHVLARNRGVHVR